MYLSEIKHEIIAPSLKEIGLYSDTALNLVTGTALPQSSVTGVASEADAFGNNGILSTVGSPVTSPTLQTFISDINPIGIGANPIGSLGYQSADDVQIISGNIGVIGSGKSNVNITLLPGSSFVTQVPLTFRGSNGNPQLTGGGNDTFLHMTDPYTDKDGVLGITFGASSTDPTIVRTDNTLTFTSDTLMGKSVIFQGKTIGDPVLQSSSVNGTLNINNPYTVDNTQSGISLGGSSTPPSITLAASGLDLYETNTSLFVAGSTYDYKNSSMSNFNNGYVQTWNEDYKGETDFISYHGTGVGGMAWYSYEHGALALLMELSGRDLSIMGNLTVSGLVNIPSYTKTKILSLTNMNEGAIVNDSTDHVPVIYENGSWYPLQLGTALSN